MWRLDFNAPLNTSKTAFKTNLVRKNGDAAQISHADCLTARTNLLLQIFESLSVTLLTSFTSTYYFLVI